MAIVSPEVYPLDFRDTKEIGLSVAHALRDELLLLTQGVETTRQRIGESISFIRGVKRATEINQHEKREQVMSNLFSSGVEYFGNTSLFVMEGRGHPSWHTKKSMPFLLSAIQARHTLLENIGSYTEIFADASDKQQYDVLRAVLCEARSVVAGKSPLGEYQVRDTEAHLSGILAEHQALTGLHEYGWTDAKYSSPEEDFHNKIDIVLPVESEDGYLGIQVKGERSKRKLSVSKKQDTQIIWVTVPTSSEKNCMKLKPTNRSILGRRVSRFVREAEGEDVASSETLINHLQTGVNRLELVQ